MNVALTDVYVELKATIADFQAKFAMAAEEISALEAAQEAASARMAESSVGVGAAMTRQAEETTAATDEIDYSLQRSALAYERVAQAAEGAAIQNSLAVEKMSADTAALSAKFELQAAKAAAANEAIDTAAVKAEKDVSAANAKQGMSYAMVGVAAAAAAGVAVDMAAKYETATTRLVTSAGETQQNLDMVRQGMLALAGQVGFTADQMAQGMYKVESAGYHGAQALDVLKNAAMGARVEGADLTEMTDAVSSAMNDYRGQNLNAADATNTLIAAVGRGKTTLQDLAGAMPNVMQAAADAGISFQEASSAMATMTMHGTDARVAATYLRQVILGLENPTAKARDAMKSLGLDSIQVSQNLGKNGLASTIEMLQNAIQSHLTPAGLVAMNSLKSASGSATDFQKVLANLPPTIQTQIGALADMVGGVKQLQGFLQLGGDNLQVFKDNTAAVTDQVRNAHGQISGWAEYQSTFNARLNEAKGALSALAVQLGSVLLPVLTPVMEAVAKTAQFFAEHRAAAIALAVVIGGIVVVAFSAAAVAAWSFTAALLANPITWIVAAVVAALVLLGAAVYELVTHWQQVKDFFVSLWHTISDAFGHAIDWIKNTVSGWIDDVKAIPGKIGSALSSMGSWIEKTATHAWRSFVDTAKAAGRAVVDFVTNLPYEIGFALGFIAATLYKGGKAAWDSFTHAITEAYKATVAFFTALPGNIAAFFAGVGDWLVREGTDLLTGLWHGIVDAYRATVQFFEELPGNIARFFEGVGDWLMGPGLDLLSGLARGIWDAARAVWDFFGRLPGDIWNFFGDAGNWLVDAGRNIVIGLANGILSMGSWLWDQVTSFARGIIDGVKSALGIASPSKVMIEMGRWTAIGMAQGITDNAHHAMNAAKDLASGIAGTVSGISANARVNVLGGTVGALGGVAPSGTILGASDSTAPVQVVINVQGSVHSENSLKRTIQDIFLQHSGRNVTNGLSGVRF